MKLPNWLRIVWWLALTALLTVFLLFRLQELLAGRSVAADIFAFLIWSALLLVPIFTEVGFFGVTLKQEIKEAKNELKEQLLELKTDIRNTVNFHPNITVYPPAPPADNELPKLEERVKRVVREQRHRSASGTPPAELKSEVPDDAIYLFSVRYSIERELRRVLRSRIPDYREDRPLTAFQMVRVLVDAQLLDTQLAGAIREVLAVCSPAIHAQEVSEPKSKFVRDVAPELIAALKGVE